MRSYVVVGRGWRRRRRNLGKSGVWYVAVSVANSMVCGKRIQGWSDGGGGARCEIMVHGSEKDGYVCNSSETGISFHWG